MTQSSSFLHFSGVALQAILQSNLAGYSKINESIAKAFVKDAFMIGFFMDQEYKRICPMTPDEFIQEMHKNL